MATRRCPKCKLINPGSTTVCDCGWSFVDQTMAEPRHLPGNRDADGEDEGDGERTSQSSRQIMIGAAFLMIGLIVTAVTYSMASSSPSGGSYLVAYGPMLYGAITLIRGLINRGG